MFVFSMTVFVVAYVSLKFSLLSSIIDRVVSRMYFAEQGGKGELQQ